MEAEWHLDDLMFEMGHAEFLKQEAEEKAVQDKMSSFAQEEGTHPTLVIDSSDDRVYVTPYLLGVKSTEELGPKDRRTAEQEALAAAERAEVQKFWATRGVTRIEVKHTRTIQQKLRSKKYSSIILLVELGAKRTERFCELLQNDILGFVKEGGLFALRGSGMLTFPAGSSHPTHRGLPMLKTLFYPEIEHWTDGPDEIAFRVHRSNLENVRRLFPECCKSDVVDSEPAFRARGAVLGMVPDEECYFRSCEDLHEGCIVAVKEIGKGMLGYFGHYCVAEKSRGDLVRQFLKNGAKSREEFTASARSWWDVAAEAQSDAESQQETQSDAEDFNRPGYTIEEYYGDGGTSSDEGDLDFEGQYNWIAEEADIERERTLQRGPGTREREDEDVDRDEHPSERALEGATEEAAKDVGLDQEQTWDAVDKGRKRARDASVPEAQADAAIEGGYDY
ncbi:hypothetical protein CYMTET_45102 [Cymbomonas tetramitiformis]|uniref:Uncharacterized protein n=1 Tax=Cymbomonas tetramitiformis TaxID=36881 RepID=A0AAE0C0M0_9CHLO|nr:hypothetical protein CYMTET_45102 [Cymbomonas tetramitiformis]